MKILVSGSTGLIGTALYDLLKHGGHDVHRLVRTSVRPRESEVHWNPSSGMIDETRLEGFEAVVHLAGENIASRRWTSEQKRRIRDSRVLGTALLAKALAKQTNPPKVFVAASAIGFYGSRGDEALTEASGAGTGFLADTCKVWEAAAEPVLAKGIRLVTMRTGIVLSPKGGALAKMLLPFKLGVGGKVGSGAQYMSWIALGDMAAAILHAILTETLSGPVNFVAPNPATNLEFTKTLGRVLKRPAVFPLPAFVAKKVFGEMGKELLLGSTRVEPKQLEASGYQFQFPELEGALRHVLGK